MLVHPCSSCGRPRPVVLSPNQPPCPACGVAAPVSADLVAALDAARAAVLNLPLRAIQLRASDMALVDLDATSHLYRWRWAYIAMPLLIASLVGVVAWSLNPWSNPDNRPDASLVVLALPLPMHLACGWVLRRRVMRDREKLRTSLQARPTTDGSFACRVCGAIVTTSLDNPVVACAYCRAPNLLDRSASIEAADEEITSFETLKAQVLARAKPATTNVVLRASLLYSPFVLFIALFGGRIALDRRLSREFHSDASVTAAAYRDLDSENGRAVTRTCLSTSPLRERIALGSLVGTKVEDSGPYWRTHVVAAVGTDGWGRSWMRSTEGRWLWHDDVCWPPRDPHGERWRAEHPKEDGVP